MERVHTITHMCRVESLRLGRCRSNKKKKNILKTQKVSAVNKNHNKLR